VGGCSRDGCQIRIIALKLMYLIRFYSVMSADAGGF
jgi:hypothetical protein